MSNFLGWSKVSKIIRETIDSNDRLNDSQKNSVIQITERIANTGVVIADEVGMGKTRIAVELIHAVKQAGGRVAIIVPTTLGFQWQKELNEREIDLAPNHTINSLWRFMHAWSDEDNHEPWGEKQVVMLSQNFANWRIGGKSHSSRWALLPEIYAQYRKKSNDRLPQGYHYHNDLHNVYDAKHCARWIIDNVYDSLKHTPSRKALLHVYDNFEWGKSSFGGDSFSSGELNSELLEKSIGLGLGAFDLIVIDEAHKSRGDFSSLSRILEKVIIQNPNARRLAMTATPVELDASQWKKMLERIQVPIELRTKVLNSIDEYADAVDALQKCWKSDAPTRERYKVAAKKFEQGLSPYLLRRDKRQEEAIALFHQVSDLPINAYRKQSKVEVAFSGLTPQWKNILCSAEGLSAVSKMNEDATAKRLRLTLGNGHGLASLLDKVNDSQTNGENEYNAAYVDEQGLELSLHDKKRLARAQWWTSNIAKGYQDGNASLYQHPAILKAIEEIETDIFNGQKALVFGRFTRPMRVLVNLLNARAMLRSLSTEGGFWPQRKIHEGVGGDDRDSEVHAVRFACQQLKLNWDVDKVNELLQKQYEQHTNIIDQRKQHLIQKIAESRGVLDARCKALFSAFEAATNDNNCRKTAGPALILLTRAIYEIAEAGNEELTSKQITQAFQDLMGAVTAENEGDSDNNGELEEKEAADLWPTIVERIREEFSHVIGGLARLMYGGTSAASRRMLQLGFNRKNSYPQVLVAQSVVGREGLNLHEACRIVYLLHPEWNPGVVEQQIGRVDRLGSRWEKEFNDYIKSDNKSDLPFIEVKPIIFEGTYDEYNWQVLQNRWDKLRSQLHGVVIPEQEREENPDLYDELCRVAPCFNGGRS